MLKRVATLVFAAGVLCAFPLVADSGVTNVTIDGNQVSAALDLEGLVDADITLTFEEVVGLTEDDLGLSAELVDPLDPNLLSRLPDPDQAGIPAAFPVRLVIEPPATGALTLSGVVAVEIYTHSLTYDSETPLRLVSAPLGDTFKDISQFMGTGSYRVRGSKGDFSEFLIITDLRSASSVIDAKFDHLDDLLSTHGYLIEPEVYSQLAQIADAAETAWLGGDRVTAIDLVEDFGDVVSANSGAAIPDVWRADGDLTNVAGQLRAAAATLRFSLNL